MIRLRSFASLRFCCAVRLLLCDRAEVVPQQDLADLTADDLQLLLSGTGGAITLDRCRKVAEFRDMRGPEVKASDPERLAAFSGLMYALALMQPGSAAGGVRDRAQNNCQDVIINPETVSLLHVLHRYRFGCGSCIAHATGTVLPPQVRFCELLPD